MGQSDRGRRVVKKTKEGEKSLNVKHKGLKIKSPGSKRGQNRIPDRAKVVNIRVSGSDFVWKLRADLSRLVKPIGHSSAHPSNAQAPPLRQSTGPGGALMLVEGGFSQGESCTNMGLDAA